MKKSGAGAHDKIPPDAFGPPPGEPTYPCKLCGRKFVKATLSKHEVACKKLQTKKRKPFESGKQRAGGGSDVPLQGVKLVQKEKEKNQGKFQPPKTHWREKHDMFINSVRAAKHVDYALKTGTPLPPPPKSMVPSDYVKCEHCGRNFSSGAAERHIPFCKEKQDRKGPTTNKQQQAMKARINYPVPKPAASAGSHHSGSSGSHRSGSNQGQGRQTSAGSTGAKPSGLPQPVSASKVPTATRGMSPGRTTNGMSKLSIKK